MAEEKKAGEKKDLLRHIWPKDRQYLNVNLKESSITKNNLRDIKSYSDKMYKVNKQDVVYLQFNNKNGKSIRAEYNRNKIPPLDFYGKNPVQEGVIVVKPKLGPETVKLSDSALKQQAVTAEQKAVLDQTSYRLNKPRQEPVASTEKETKEPVASTEKPTKTTGFLKKIKQFLSKFGTLTTSRKPKSTKEHPDDIPMQKIPSTAQYFNRLNGTDINQIKQKPTNHQGDVNFQVWAGAEFVDATYNKDTNTIDFKTPTGVKSDDLYDKNSMKDLGVTITSSLRQSHNTVEKGQSTDKPLSSSSNEAGIYIDAATQEKINKSIPPSIATDAKHLPKKEQSLSSDKGSVDAELDALLAQLTSPDDSNKSKLNEDNTKGTTVSERVAERRKKLEEKKHEPFDPSRPLAPSSTPPNPNKVGKGGMGTPG